MNTEKELIQQSLMGDESAFEQLMTQNRSAVFCHCLKIVHDEQIAQDLTQEAFLHAYQHLDRFRMQAKFSTWIWRITHNLCLSYLKKHAPISYEFHEEYFVSSKEVDEGEWTEWLDEVVEKLPYKQRIVFEMYALQGIPQKQIAQELGIALGTVRSRLYYARQRIKLWKDIIAE